MAKRYYVCDVVGTGSESDPYRPAVADLGVNHVAVIPTDPATGRPLHPWCLVLVATVNHARVAAARGVDALPDVTLDTQWNATDKGKRDAAAAALARRGITPPGIAPGDGFRGYVRGLGRQLQADFVEDNFDVGEGA